MWLYDYVYVQYVCTSLFMYMHMYAMLRYVCIEYRLLTHECIHIFIDYDMLYIGYLCVCICMLCYVCMHRI